VSARPGATAAARRSSAPWLGFLCNLAGAVPARSVSDSGRRGLFALRCTVDEHPEAWALARCVPAPERPRSRCSCARCGGRWPVRVRCPSSCRPGHTTPSPSRTGPCAGRGGRRSGAAMREVRSLAATPAAPAWPRRPQPVERPGAFVAQATAAFFRRCLGGWSTSASGQKPAVPRVVRSRRPRSRRRRDLGQRSRWWGGRAANRPPRSILGPQALRSAHAAPGRR
jgi:hypothetical protein